MNPCAPWACAFALTVISTCSQAGSSLHKWSEFEGVAGQPYPVPKRWLATPNGRLTHNIVLPDSMPKPVPFDFTQAKLRALLPFSPSVGDQYWQHLCATEAGQYIFETVKPVEGLALMRVSTVVPKDEDEADIDDWMYEAGFLEVPLTHKYGPEFFAARFIQWPHFTYRAVEVPNPVKSNWIRFSRVANEPLNVRSTEAIEAGKWKSATLEAPTERYGVTWRGLVRPQDRVYRIAGFEIIVFDRLSGEVLSVVRSFQHGKRTWRNAAGCPQMYTNFADPADAPYVLLAFRTLLPDQAPTFLQSNDQRILQRRPRP